MRTDDNNNPTAFTVDIAKEAGLFLGVDYEQGEPFRVGGSSGPGITYYTAKLLGDPIAITIRVIDAIGFYTSSGAQRWSYIAVPKFVWNGLPDDDSFADTSSGVKPATKLDVIGFMYEREGGTQMWNLFPNYGAL